MTDYKLISERVDQLLNLCFVSNEPTEGTIAVLDSVTAPCYMDSALIAEHKAEIDAMLMQLPDNFMASKGGGYSFIAAAYTNTGEQWTGLQANVAALFVLGLATGKVKLLLPRDMWDLLPGNVPYYIVLD